MSVKLPVCSTCNRPILPKDEAVKFVCPNCGEVVIWRCSKCRKFVREYKCISCGFVGP